MDLNNVLIPIGILLIGFLVYMFVRDSRRRKRAALETFTPTEPPRVLLRSERMPKIAMALLTRFVITSTAIVVLVIPCGREVGELLAGAGDIPVVGWGRSLLHGDAVSIVSVISLLVVSSAAAIAAQYLAYGDFTDRGLSRAADPVERGAGRGERALAAVSTMFVAGFGEEIIYRALLPAGLYASGGNIGVAILLPYAVWVAQHERRTRAILNSAIIGVAMTYVYLVTEQLAWAIAVHVAANAMATLIAPEVRLALNRRRIRVAIDIFRARAEAS